LSLINGQRYGNDRQWSVNG